jgi:hypothetical protein
MQRAPDRVADHQSVDELAAVMGATSADREPLTARARDQHLVLANVSQHHGAVCNAVGGDASREVGCVDLLGVIHDRPLRGL